MFVNLGKKGHILVSVVAGSFHLLLISEGCMCAVRLSL